ncbi:clustered mitochondria protein homolog [Elysia marginata]|uniref:Clustered mitochondria protein homolog n=1 Tax=Elysia marginata TaxID=1093978 RepID=A0AAV4IR52_9GAST|nr:clustered mitochondria protein homolog [Elysia marginata]
MAGITTEDDRENSQNKGCSTQDTATKPNKEAINGHESMKPIVLDRQNVEAVEDKEIRKSEENGEKENAEAETEKEVLLIQDTGFNVKIAAPNLDVFELPVSSMELVQEIHQVLMDREDTCQRTCFSLQLDGQTMDNFSELKSIEGLKEGSTIKVVEEPYTVREARIHVRHVRDLMKSVDQADSYNGVDCSSLSFLNTITLGDILDKKRNKPDSVDCTPPDAIIPNSKDRPLLPLHPGIKDAKSSRCLKVLTYSGWNPPPGNRRMHGDLLYLYVVTLEDKRYHITGCTRGFYLNQSTEDEFKPKQAQPKYLSHSLVDLLNQISPAFKRSFSALLKKRSQKHPFERVPTPYQMYVWMAPQADHQVDYIRAEDAFSTRLGYEEHIPGQTRDWNEEIQTTRELPKTNLPERLIRERAIFKVHSDFVAAATRGAMAVIDGNVMAINPGEDAKMQMFIWNNIFFSLGFDVKDHYKDFGGDAAAHAAPSNDLQGVKAYFNMDPDHLYTLGTVVVDYRGYRVTAQSIIPGILEREQEQSVVYGSVDFGKTVVSNDKYRELLQKTAAALKIRPHKVLNSEGEAVELYSSIECKGIIGNDQRHYILDLLRTFPPDANYLPVEGEELSEFMKIHGYPKKHRHKLPCLRQELIEAFIESRYLAFVKHAALQFQALQKQSKKNSEEKAEKEKEKPALTNGHTSCDENKNKLEEEGVSEEAKKLVEDMTGTEPGSLEDDTKEIVRKAAQASGSLSETEFSITFNPDVFQPHVSHVDPDINDFLDHTSSPVDGITLTESMHARGINVRYLGKVAETLAKYQTLSYVYTIAISELICRSTKHLFCSFMQGVDMMNTAAAISHFLNCFLGSYPTPHASVTAEEIFEFPLNKYFFFIENTEWTSESPKSLWKKIIDEADDYYGYTLECDSIEGALEQYGCQRVAMLRSICLKAGVQIQLREYALESKARPIFTEDDIVNVFPVVKHISPRATDAFHFFSSGQTKIQQGLLREGYELISEALNLLNNVYGAMHPEIAACLRLLARLNYIMGEFGEAMSYQQRAVLMSERVMGIDHPNTITEYAHLALYCFANSQVTSALRLMYRARYLAILCHGEDHPEVALIDSNIGLILQAVEEYDFSLKYLEHALQLNMRYFGQESLKTAMTYHLVARTHSCRGDFRSALQSEKEAFSIYKSKLGENHDRTRESSECLAHLTKQAVVVQKKMNEIYKGEVNSSLPPIQIQPPSLAGVLETLNVINGIVFVQISPDELEKFKQEMSKRQSIEQAEETSTSSSSSAINSVKSDAAGKETTDSGSGGESKAKGSGDNAEVKAATAAETKKIGDSVMVEGIALA